MKNAVLSAIASVLVVGATAAQAQTPGPHRPAGVPEGYVITPFGYFHPSCVVHLAQGDDLRPDRNVIQHANGTVESMPVCAYRHYRADGEAVFGDEHHVKNPNISHSWIVSESVTATSSYYFLNGYWSVPPAPADHDGQTLYYFNGLEDSNDVVTILQPVLGWNSDYADAWGIASWNCCEKGTTYEATPEPVSSGDTILGYTYYTCKLGTAECGTWDVVTQDLQNGKVSELTKTSNFKQTFNWAFGGVLEVYNVVQCGDYPNTPSGMAGGHNSMTFNHTELFNDSGSELAPNWSLTKWVSSTATPQCNYGGSTPSEINLNF